MKTISNLIQICLLGTMLLALPATAQTLNVSGTITSVSHTWQPIAFPGDALVDSSVYGSLPFTDFNLTNGTTLSITWSAPAGEMFVVTPPPAALGTLQLRFGLGFFPFIGDVASESFSSSSVAYNLVSGSAPATYGEIGPAYNGWDCFASSTIASTNSSFAFTSITLTQQFFGSSAVTMSPTLNWEPYSVILFGGNTNDPTDPGSLLTLQPYQAPPPQFTFTTNNGTITVTSYIGTNSVVNVPSLINGSLVTTIASLSGAFTNLSISGSVINIGEACFTGCSNLTAITVDPNNPVYYSTGGVLFAQNPPTLIAYPAALEGNYTIPGNVTGIGPWAFWRCYNLTSVTIPDSVTTMKDDSIGDFGGFFQCLNLTNVSLGSGVTNIGDGAFNGCSKLTSMTIPDSVTTIEAGAFNECYGLTNVNFGRNVISIGNDAFYNCRLAGVTLPNSVTSIGDSAFAFALGSSGLMGITIPNSVTSIGSYAFYGCSGLTNAIIGSGVTYMGDAVFLNDGLTGLYFLGNAPAVQPDTFVNFLNSMPPTAMLVQATAYYLSGTTGWGATIGGGLAFFNDPGYGSFEVTVSGLPTAVWILPTSPALGISAYGGQPAVFFPTATGTNFVLQMTTNLASGNWVPVTNGVPISGLVITNPPANAFFRLH